MRTESNIRPEEVVIERTGTGMCEVILNTNIQEVERENIQMDNTDSPATMTVYEYDSYRFELSYRSGLKEEIGKNLSDWIEYAKKSEELPQELSDKEKIEYLLKKNATLTEDNEMLKGCIMEIADVVFA